MQLTQIERLSQFGDGLVSSVVLKGFLSCPLFTDGLAEALSQ